MTTKNQQCNTCANYCHMREDPVTPQEMMAGFVLYVAPCVLLVIWISSFGTTTALARLGFILFGLLLSSGFMCLLRPFGHLWQNKTGEVTVERILPTRERDKK